MINFMSEKKLLSIIIPAFNEEKNIEYIYSKINKLFNDKIKKYNYEIIFINDGSIDNTWKIIKNICKNDISVKWINLSKNFWKEIALTVWVEKSKWHMIVTLDADWQMDIDILPEFIKQWEDWCDIVYWIRIKITRTIFRKLTSFIFNTMMSIISDLKFDDTITDFILIDRKVISHLLKYEDKNRIFRWIVLSLWFKKWKVYYKALDRLNWKSSLSYTKLYKLAIDSITSFSIFPLKSIWYLWIFITILSIWLLCFMFISKFLLWNPLYITNIAFFVIFNLLLSWITLIWLWIIAIYIASIKTEVTKRPLYITKDEINF